jgi:hypothetical protein
MMNSMFEKAEGLLRAMLGDQANFRLGPRSTHSLEYWQASQATLSGSQSSQIQRVVG